MRTERSRAEEIASQLERRRVAPFRFAAALLLAACASSPPATTSPPVTRVEPLLVPIDAASDAAVAFDAAGDADVDASPVVDDDPEALHVESRDALLALTGDPEAFARFDFGVGPSHVNQGNKAVAHHAVGRRTCVDGLKDVTIQTSEQRTRCGGRSNMVPVWAKGDATKAKFCIDVFEFPNEACELPFVWTSPSRAEKLCEAKGERLCSQEEWMLACRADPEGGADRVYAYGDTMDLHVCNTDKSRVGRKTPCDLQTLDSIWNTCTTDTEPSGAYPGCRSRFGVFDMHGNVAEIMTRKDSDGVVYSQLKGSAFHYVDLAKKPTDRGGYWTKYPDHCNFDPRWHVEELKEAAHVNYHLGFRCCGSVAAP
jgi:sulfatase modifying factor 1